MGVVRLLFLINGISYEVSFLRKADKMQKDTLRIEQAIRSSKDVGNLIITNNEQLDWTVFDYYFPEYKHCMLKDVSNIDKEGCWYILDSGTDIEEYKKSGKKMVYIDSGIFGDGYDIDLYKVY